MPEVLWELYVAERFHMWPADLRKRPAEEVHQLMRLLSIEAEMPNLTAGLGPDELLYDETSEDDATG